MAARCSAAFWMLALAAIIAWAALLSCTTHAEGQCRGRALHMTEYIVKQDQTISLLSA